MSYTDAIFDASNPVSPLSVPASQTAVLLLDLQRFLIPRISESAGTAVVSSAVAVRSWARAHGMLVIHGLIDTATPTFATLKRAARMAPMIESVRAQPETAEEVPELRVEQDSHGEVTLRRTLGQFSSLKLRGLEELLRQRGIRSLVIGGISTSGTVLRTALGAADDGFIVTIIEEACADPDPAVHETVLRKIVTTNVHVSAWSDWTEHWEKQGKL